MKEVYGIVFRLCREITGFFEYFCIAGYQHTAAACGHNLVAVERERADIADCSRKLPCKSACPEITAERLRCILYDLKSETLLQIHEFFHVSYVSEDVDDYDCGYVLSVGFVSQFSVPHLAFFEAEAFEFVHVHAESVVAVHEHGLGIHVFHGVNGSDKGQSWHNHFVARVYSAAD